MTAMKRKFRYEPTAHDGFRQATKKLKTDAGPISADFRSPESCLDGDAHAKRIADRGDTSDGHGPISTKQDNDRDGGMPDASRVVHHTPRFIQRLPRHTTSTISKDAKQRLLDEQVSFIIVTRDNNKPDPYGEASTEEGPLSWTAVAKLYNAKFGVTNGFAAMEKRARQHRDAWMAARPQYPRKIQYAEKVKVTKPKAQRGKPARQVAKTMGHEDDAVDDGQAERDAEMIKSDAVLESEPRKLRVGGWLPPDATRNHADLDNYIHQSVQISESDQTEWVTIEVEETDGKSLGHVDVRLHDLRKSSAWIAQELVHSTGICIKLVGSSKAAVARYVQCISPERSSKLPEFDLKVNADVDASAMCAPSDTRIDWDFASLADLYAVATQLGDHHVRAMVMAQWHEMLQQNIELELDPEDMNHLFHSTSLNDPAREFWAAALYTCGMAQQIVDIDGFHTTLAAKLKELMSGEIAPRPHGCRATVCLP